MNKTNSLKAVLLGALVTLQASAAPSTDDAVFHALRVLKGQEYGISEQQALSLVREAAEAGESSVAMNALGMFRLSGMYEEADTASGVRLLEAAGRNGYADAYHNLGVAYKLARYGMSQDFKKAFSCYSVGADSGSVSCMYDTGYMLYKGLGCRQDYEKAADYFRRAADFDHPHSLYMLGLCYRNGYGTEQDDEQADFYLGRAATLGLKAAIEEQMRPQAENSLGDIPVSDVTGATVPETMPEINPQVNDTSIVRGDYTGFLVMYDWSGQHVIGEKPVAATINRDAEGLYGNLVLGMDTIPYKADITADGRMEFRNVTTSMNERYTPGMRTPYHLDNVQLDIWNDHLKGDMRLYNLKEKEPERPMYLELQRMNADSKTNAYYCHVTAAPNPFSVSFNAIFELEADVNAKVRIFNQLGVAIYTNDLGTLEKGKHFISITPNISDGTYVLNISAGKQVFRTIIVKKGGAE